MKKGIIYKWNEDCQKAFETLKQKLIEAPILQYPNFNKEMILYTDASNTGIGAILGQQDDNKKDHVIAYASRTLTKAERNYSTTEKECLAVVWAVGYFRHYLHGQHFKIVTDHNPLKWLKKHRSSSTRLERWSLKLEPFDYDIEYRPGRIHSNVDALSRLDSDQYPCEKPIKSISTYVCAMETAASSRIQSLQETDEVLGPIRKYLQERHLPGDNKIAQDVVTEAAGYELVEGILYRSVPTPNMLKRGKTELRLAVPQTMIQEIMMANHNDLLAGHLGIKRTYAKVANRYYWRGMYDDIVAWVNACLDCAMRKMTPNSAAGELNTITVSRPFEIVGADILGPLPRTIKGNRYILVFTDHFTKWIEASAIPKQDATTIAECFIEDIQCRHGTPQKLLTDRGKAFIGNVMQEVTRLLGTKKINTSPYRPQTNGLTERFNKTLVEMLSMYVSSHQKDWDTYLPYVLYAYRTSVHATTGETPFYLLYGRDAWNPSDLLECEIQQQQLNVSIEEYKSELVKNLRKIHEEVQHYDNIMRQKRERDALNDKKTKEFKIGDLVWLYTRPAKKGLSPKLMHPWHGPYRIVEILSPLNVKIRALNGRVIKQAVHVTRLKKYNSPEYPREDVPMLPEEDNFNLDEEIAEEDIPEKEESTKTKEKEVPHQENSMEVDIEGDNEDSQEYEVEAIVNHRFRNGNKEYLVKWKNFSDYKNTWEPMEHMTHCKDAIDQYEQMLEAKECPLCGLAIKSRQGQRVHMKKYHMEHETH